MTPGIDRPDGTPIAVRFRAGRGPTLVFLPGYASDMTGSKASALWDWAQDRGQAIALFDYGGCGASGGAFEAQSFDDWLGDALRLVDAVSGPVLLVGSSMGGWISLHVALARPARIAGLIGIAAAPDFTEWGLSVEDRQRLAETGRIETPSRYDDSILVQTQLFVDSADRHGLLGGPLQITCPVRLLHGQHDADVPWRIALSLAEAISGTDVEVTLVKQGDHRLSDPRDLELLCSTVARLCGVCRAE